MMRRVGARQEIIKAGQVEKVCEIHVLLVSESWANTTKKKIKIKIEKPRIPTKEKATQIMSFQTCLRTL
jgi:hypothetical protein